MHSIALGAVQQQSVESAGSSSRAHSNAMLQFASAETKSYCNPRTASACDPSKPALCSQECSRSTTLGAADQSSRNCPAVQRSVRGSGGILRFIALLWPPAGRATAAAPPREPRSRAAPPRPLARASAA
jgi:hypothetical protein